MDGTRTDRHTVSLADARAAALEARRLCRPGIDPIEHRKVERAAQAAQRGRGDDLRSMPGQVYCRQQGWLARRKASEAVDPDARNLCEPSIWRHCRSRPWTRPSSAGTDLVDEAGNGIEGAPT